MTRLHGLLLLAAACNQPQTGAEEVLDFTPTACGYRLIGCDFADAIAVGGAISVQIDRRDGGSTIGLDLRSADATRLVVTPTADLGGRPTWDLSAAAAGAARLVAVDGAGDEVDFIDVELVDPIRLGLDKVIGEADGPNPEPPAYDEAWQIFANQPVGFGVTARRDAGVRVMGRLSVETVLPAGSTLLDHEDAGSDRPSGYLAISPPIGSYEVSFELTGRPEIKVDAVIRATPTP